MHANSYFEAVDRLEQEAFEQGDGAAVWPPYADRARGGALARAVALAASRETTVKLVRRALATWLSTWAPPATMAKLLKDVPESCARKRARAVGTSALERAAVGVLAAGTSFRAGALFAAADFIVSVATDAVRAAWGAVGGVPAPAAALAAARGAADDAVADVAGTASRSIAALAGAACASAGAAAALAFLLAAPALAPTAPVAALAAAAIGADIAARAATARFGPDAVASAAARVQRHAVRAAACLAAASAAGGAAATLLPPGLPITAAVLVADNAAYMLLVAPALADQAETGRVRPSRALPLAAAAAATGAWGMSLL
jgi:hypothetical protein